MRKQNPCNWTITLVTPTGTEIKHYEQITYDTAVLWAKGLIGNYIEDHPTTFKVICRMSNEFAPDLVTVVKKTFSKWADYYGWEVHTFRIPRT
jgi:hypothetical protein